MGKLKEKMVNDFFAEMVFSVQLSLLSSVIQLTDYT